LSWYGRLWGVNWIWLIALTTYHGVISIFIPIALTDIVFKELKDQPFIQSKRKLLVIATIFIFDVILFNRGFMGSYPLHLIYYLLCFTMIFTFYSLAGKIIMNPLYRPSKASIAWFIGLVWMALFYIIYFGLPYSTIPPILVAVIGILHTYFGVRYYSIFRIEEIRDSVKLASLIGPPSFFILLSPFREISKTRQDNPTGMTITGMVFALIFIILYRRVSIRESHGIKVFNSIIYS
jgi:hypothetical protein